MWTKKMILRDCKKARKRREKVSTAPLVDRPRDFFWFLTRELGWVMRWRFIEGETWDFNVPRTCWDFDLNLFLFSEKWDNRWDLFFLKIGNQKKNSNFHLCGDRILFQFVHNLCVWFLNFVSFFVVWRRRLVVAVVHHHNLYWDWTFKKIEGVETIKITTVKISMFFVCGDRIILYSFVLSMYLYA